MPRLLCLVRLVCLQLLFLSPSRFSNRIPKSDEVGGFAYLLAYCIVSWQKHMLAPPYLGLRVIDDDSPISKI
jgi:hypothetical protein